MIVQDDEEVREPLAMPTDIIKVASCDVSSLQEAFENGFQNFVKAHTPDIICLQIQNETNNVTSTNDSLSDKYQLDGYKGYIIANYSTNNNSNAPAGTVLFTRIKPIKVSRADFEENDGIKENDNSVMTIEFTNFFIVNAIASGLHGDENKVTKWFESLQKLLNDLNGQKTTLLCGNFKVSHQAIDISNTDNNAFKYFEDEQNRKRFSDFLSDTYVDIFRTLHPDKQQFTYFPTEAGKANESKNKCRIDYFIAPNEAIETKIVVDCSIVNSDNFSKHSPIVLLLDKEKLISTEHDVSVELLPADEKKNEVIFPPNHSEIHQEAHISNSSNDNKIEEKNEAQDNETAINNDMNEYGFEYEHESEYDEVNEDESSDDNEEEEIQLAHGRKIITRRNKGRFFDFSRHAVSNGKGRNRSGKKYDNDDYTPIKRPNIRSKPKPKKTTDSNSAAPNTEHRGRGRPRKAKPEK